MIRNASNGKPRGYAFIEFEKERDMHAAYKSADGNKIDGRRVLVDVERGRTVKGWRPRRLGGGFGNTRAVQNEDESGQITRERERGRSRDDISSRIDGERRRDHRDRSRAGSSPRDRDDGSRR